MTLCVDKANQFADRGNVLTPGINSSLWYRVRRRDLVCHQFRKAKWSTILCLPRQPGTNVWRRKPRVVSTGVVVGLLEWAAMDAARHTLASGEDILGTGVAVTHCAPARRGAQLYITAECATRHGQYTVWEVHAYHGAVEVAYGTTSFAVVQVDPWLDKWTSTEWARWWTQPRWCHRAWRQICYWTGTLAS